MENQKRIKKQKVSIGDVYAVKLPDGRYGALRIVNCDRTSYLLATTPYIGETIPMVENNVLSKTLLQNRFYFENAPAICWFDGKIPETFIYIGNIQGTKKMKQSIYGGTWDETTGMEAFYEWRWINDRDNFENEILEEERKIEQLMEKPQKPRKMMTDETFWYIISLLDWESVNDEDEVIEVAVRELEKMGVRNIKQFEEAMSYKLYLLDTKEHANNIGEYSFSKNKDDYFSPDVFLYLRCEVIAKGEDFFNAVLEYPALMPKENTFEPLLSIATESYERLTGKEFQYITGCDYETFSNVVGWK